MSSQTRSTAGALTLAFEQCSTELQARAHADTIREDLEGANTTMTIAQEAEMAWE